MPFYIIRIGDYFKIGKTKNIKNRLKTYSSYPPFEHEVILSEEVVGYSWYERYMQTYFIKHQVKGEWFLYDESLGDLKEKSYKVFNVLDKITKDIIKEHE